MFDTPSYKIADGEKIGKPASPLGFGYIFSADGVYIHAENKFIRAIFKIGSAEVRGLPVVAECIKPKHNKLPISLLDTALVDMRKSENEVMYVMVFSAENGLSLERLPDTSASPSHVEYSSGRYESGILDLHSHAAAPAFFSATDDNDEDGFRWYCVIGNVWNASPTVALRVGVHGYHQKVALTTLFDGVGQFTDIHSETNADIAASDAAILALMGDGQCLI